MKKVFILFLVAISMTGCLLSDNATDYQISMETIQYHNGEDVIRSRELALLKTTTKPLDEQILHDLGIDSPSDPAHLLEYEASVCLASDKQCISTPPVGDQKCLCGGQNEKRVSCEVRGTYPYSLDCPLDLSWINENREFYLLINYVKNREVNSTVAQSPLLSAQILGVNVRRNGPEVAPEVDGGDAGDGADAGADAGGDGKIDLVGNNPFNLADAAKAPVNKSNDKGGGCFNIAGSSPSFADFLFLALGAIGLYLRRGFRR